MLPYTLTRTVDAALEPVLARELESHLRLDATNKEPVPTAPSVALASPAAPGNLSVGVYRYRVTFVTADGETDGGEISAAVAVTNAGVNGQVELTSIPVGGGAVTARRIWRTLVNGSTFFLLQALNDNTTTTLTDNTADVVLGSQCPTNNTTADPELTRLIRAARSAVENYTKRALLQQTWRQRMTRFPEPGCPIWLMKPTLRSVSSVIYLDVAGESQVMDPWNYELEVESLPGKLWPALNVEWPETYSLASRPNTVLVEFKAGYGTERSHVPDGIRHAVLIHAADLYAHRESFVTGTIVQDLNFTAKNLLAEFIWREAT